MLCTLCERDAAQPLSLGDTGESCCLGCAWRIGRMTVEVPSLLLPVWPILEDDEDEGPEPKVRLPDGSSVELRERTAELKRGLPIEKRMELAEMMGELGLVRERLLEAGFVLSNEVAPELAQRALNVLFAREHLSAEGLALLRPMLLPS